jgi:predicted dehydrogenase
MSDISKHTGSRRRFLKNTGRVAVASALVGTTVPRVHAAENNTIHLALVGCGGRGTGAVKDAIKAEAGPVKLVAMSDVFENRLAISHKNLTKLFPDEVDVPEDQKFVGFDGYKKAIDCLSPGDVVIFATPPAFRWVHFTYAVEKGVHVFMEKPVTVDGPTTRRMIGLAEEADKKNLKVGVGLMIRHCRARLALKDRIDSGEIGEIISMRAYRLGTQATNAYAPARTADDQAELSELLYQVRRFHSFLWASGGVYSDYYIHQIDECSWMKGAWPVEAHALGGRHYRGESVDQNLDTYSVEYTFPDSTKLFYFGRNMNGAERGFSSYAHGTKGVGVISASGHAPRGICLYHGRDHKNADPAWAFPQPAPHNKEMEWKDLIEAIRQDKPYNEAKRGAEASLVTSMGRMAAHTGRTVTFDEILNSDHEFAPDIDKLTMDSPAPLLADAQGKYPIPMPGLNTKREF